MGIRYPGRYFRRAPAFERTGWRLNLYADVRYFTSSAGFTVARCKSNSWRKLPLPVQPVSGNPCTQYLSVPGYTVCTVYLFGRGESPQGADSGDGSGTS